MQRQVSLRVLPSEANDDSFIKKAIANALGLKTERVTGFYKLKESLDARSRIVWINIVMHVYVDEPYHQRPAGNFTFLDTTKSHKRVIIIGAGPAGLFAALYLLEKGIKPIILERGKDVRARRRDLAMLNKEGIVNPDSNYCFGEGGAGTYSDGKLYTRSTKRGDVNRILQLLVLFGAPEPILYEAHPHIGTNKLPQIIVAMRQLILDCGGEIRFEHKLTGFKMEQQKIQAVQVNESYYESADAYILATGHSARDIFRLMHRQNILIEAKPFALGVRVEHPQALIDGCQYHLQPGQPERPGFLPPAAYSLVHQAEGRGVFSFCMCPGGIIAPAATDPGELVVNGWSPSKRNNSYANSGMVVQVSAKDAFDYLKKVKQAGELLPVDHPLMLMQFQQQVEQKAFDAGGGKFVAPAQRMVDFTEGRVSAGLPPNSYLPGLNSVDINNVLPPFTSSALKEGLKAFGKKMPSRNGRSGYFTNEAIVVATESRTSSPVRIPRDETTLEHPQLGSLYPCGEGGGYAGGIVSAAMDGERVAAMITARLGG